MSNSQEIQVASTKLSILPVAAEERQCYLETILTEINDGELKVLNFHANLKNVEKMVKLFTESPEYREALITAVKKGTKGEIICNTLFEITETGIKYDYTPCNDPLMDSLLVEEASLKAQIKVRGAFLQKIPKKGMIVTDGETGETTTIFPPNKTSTTSVKATEQ